MLVVVLKFWLAKITSASLLDRSGIDNLVVLTCLLAASACSGTVRDPGYEFQIGVGEQFIQSGEYDRGYRVLDKVAELNAEAGQVQMAVAESYFSQGALLKANSHYERAMELGEATAGMIGKARVALAKNEADLAISLFEAVLKENARSMEALNGIGVAYDILEQHDLAQSYYRHVIEYEPDNVNALNNLALSQTLNGDRSSGEKLFIEIYSSALNNPTVRQNTAFVNAINGKTKRALELYGSYLTEQKKYHNITIAEHFGKFL